MSANVIELKNVTKTYGSNRGVRNISLDVKQGSIFGFLGPNGAGKTTTISMLVDLLRPTKGSLNIFGLDTHKDGVAIRRRVGFLAGDFALDGSLTGWQQLTYFGNLHGGVNRQRAQQLAKRLDCNLSRQIKNLSRGNKQKVGLISALMHDPELLIFDEPTSGLDPLIQAEFNKILAEHQAQGKTAFISSHMLSEVQAICSEVGFIRDGKLIAVQKLDDLGKATTKHIHVVTTNDKLVKELRQLNGVKIQLHEGKSLNFTLSGDINALLKLLASHEVTDVTITEADLETVFMEYYGDKNV